MRERLTTKEEAFLNELGIEKEELAKAILKHPQLAGYDPARIKKVWKDELGIEKEELAKAILKFPPLAGYSVKNNIKLKVGLLYSLNVGKDEIMEALITIVTCNARALRFILTVSADMGFTIDNVDTLKSVYMKLSISVKRNTKVTIGKWFQRKSYQEIDEAIKPLLLGIINRTRPNDTPGASIVRVVLSSVLRPRSYEEVWLCELAPTDEFRVKR